MLVEKELDGVYDVEMQSASGLTGKAKALMVISRANQKYATAFVVECPKIIFTLYKCLLELCESFKLFLHLTHSLEYI